VQAPRPLANVDKELDEKFMLATQRVFFYSYIANLLNGEPGSKPEEAAKKVTLFTAKMIEARDSMAFLKDSHPEMWEYLNGLAKIPKVLTPEQKAAEEKARAEAEKAKAEKAKTEPAPAPMPRRSCIRCSMQAFGSMARIPISR
jgi:hypothetical protein